MSGGGAYVQGKYFAILSAAYDQLTTFLVVADKMFRSRRIEAAGLRPDSNTVCIVDYRQYSENGEWPTCTSYPRLLVPYRKLSGTNDV